MAVHKEFREKFGNVLESDNAVQVCEAIEKWLIDRENSSFKCIAPERTLPCRHYFYGNCQYNSHCNYKEIESTN